MILPAILYVVFTLLSVVGAYLIGAHFRSRKAGVIFGLAVLLFFIGLAVYVDWLVRMGEGTTH